jgi:hypothetical protein
MGIKDQLSAEQFKVLCNAPFAAAAYAAVASGGGFEMVSELLNASKFMGQQIKAGGETGYGALVDGVLADMKSMSHDEVRALTIHYEGKDPAALRAQVKQVVADAGAIVAGMPDADGYKRWILDIGKTVVATKTGGFLGIGAKSVVDEQEQAALDELAAMLEMAS